MSSPKERKEQLRVVAELLRIPRDRGEMEAVLEDLLTPAEIADIAERWNIVQLLLEETPQREVNRLTGVSISKITRASHVLTEAGQGFRLLRAKTKT